MRNHPQKFQLRYKLIGNREWLGLQHMKEGVDYERVDPPRLVDHIPPGEWIYVVVGDGLDYIHCPECFPGGGQVLEQRPIGAGA